MFFFTKRLKHLPLKIPHYRHVIIPSIQPEAYAISDDGASVHRSKIKHINEVSVCLLISPFSYFRKSAISTSRRNTDASPPPSPSYQSLRFHLERDVSPSQSISSVSRDQIMRNNRKSHQTSSGKQMCMYSSMTHPGSFQCNLFKNSSVILLSSSSHHRLNARRLAKTNSLERIETVEGDLVKRALAPLIRPSSHQQRRLLKSMSFNFV